MMLTPKTPESPPPNPDLPLPAALTPYGAKTHLVEVRWRARNSERLVIGPEPKLVLAVRARREVELLTLLVEYPKMGDRDMAGQSCEAVLVQVPHVCGLRRLRPEGEPWVWGQEGVDARAMFGGKPEDAASEPAEIRWHGYTVNCLEYNANPHPCIWWSWRGRVLVPKHASLGVIVRATAPTVCTAKLAGV